MLLPKEGYLLGEFIDENDKQAGKPLGEWIVLQAREVWVELACAITIFICPPKSSHGRVASVAAGAGSNSYPDMSIDPNPDNNYSSTNIKLIAKSDKWL